jgi:ParB family chromosome partitioning protein
MASNKNALGKGLSALLENANTDITSEDGIVSSSTANSISRININHITTNPFQPRIDFEKEDLIELSNSIREHGIIQPITVRKLGRDNFQIISGERRYQASKIVNIEEIPCYIRIANDQNMLEMAIVENVQRKDLNAIEISLSYQRLIDECELTHEQLREKFSKKRSTITNYLRLLKLPVVIQKGVRENKISMGHARALLSLNSEKEMISAYNDIVNNKLSVRATEKKKDNKKEINPLDPALSRYELRMQNNLTYQFKNKVKINKTKKGSGQIIISFKNEEDLNNILDTFDQ